MLPRAVQIGTLTVMGLVCMAAAACTDDGQRPEDWRLDGDVRDAASDAGPADVLDVQDATDTRDTTDVAPLDCTCAVDGATCERMDGRAVCVVDGAECDFDVHGAKCRPECTDHADCGQKQYCNVNDRCFPRRRCDFNGNHALCPAGYWCDPDLKVPGTCRRSGGKPVGGSCEDDWQCESGECCDSGDCNEGTCLRRCLAEEDCSSRGRSCGRFNNRFSNLRCYAPPDGYSDCEISCAEDHLCTDDKCRPHACHRTAQCPEGDCIISPKGFADESLGQCTEERLCNGWEFRIEEDDPFCRLAIDCDSRYNPEDFTCPEGYECVEGEDNHQGTSWCSRRVTEGEWP